MNTRLIAIGLLCLTQVTRAADADAVAAIKAIITENFAAMRAARTREDIARAVDAMDSPNWISVLPNGDTMTRADALRELDGQLFVKPEKRESPQVDFVYWNPGADSTTVLYWVYRNRDGDLFGSLARDTWTRSGGAWRRTRHEKLFPDRPLLEGGKSVILPPLADHISRP